MGKCGKSVMRRVPYRLLPLLDPPPARRMTLVCVGAFLVVALFTALAPAHEPDERAVAPDAGAYRLTPAYVAGSAAERAGMDAEMGGVPGAAPPRAGPRP